MYARTNAGNTALITEGRPITAQKNRVTTVCGVAAHRVADDHGVAQVQSIGEFDKQIPEFDGAQRRGR
jgi:hypothetical protein